MGILEDYEYKRYHLMPRADILLHPGSDGPEERYPSINDPAAFKDYFEREGFICIRQAIPQEMCTGAKQAFLQEVLPDRRTFFLRHESGRLERHVINEQGFMTYPIMNIQDISGNRFGSFKRLGLNILTAPVIQQAVSILFNEPGRLIHTMYFDGNQVTWAHRDGHYIDSQKPGGMIGVWVATEDIQPGAGRFYIVPRSHRMPVPGELSEPDGQEYKALMAEFVRHGPLACVAPVLTQGDILLWSSYTIHGSLPTTDRQFSRRSFTAHYIPQSQQFTWRDGSDSPRTIAVNGVQVTLHGNQQAIMKSLAHTVSADYPALARILKRVKRRLRS